MKDGLSEMLKWLISFFVAIVIVWTLFFLESNGYLDMALL